MSKTSPRPLKKDEATVEIIDLTKETDDLMVKDTDCHEQVLVMINDIPFTDRQRRILLDPTDWLTDEIINAYAGRLMEKSPKVHCCSTFFDSRIKDNFDVAWIKKWWASIREEVELIMIPINWGNTHWALACYSISEGVLRYYDSMMSSSHSARALGPLKKALEECKASPRAASKNQLNDTTEIFRKKKYNNLGVLAFIMSKMSIKENVELKQPIQLETPGRQPQQTDASSCGVFVCWWMARLSSFIPIHQNINPVEFRKEILDTILQ